MPGRMTNEQHKANGTYKPERHGNFTLPIEIPDPPRGMSRKAKYVWKEITDLFYRAGIITEVDWMLVGLLCDTIVLYREAQKSIEKDGLTYDSTTARGTATKSNPAINVRKDCVQQIISIIRQFGLTPVARGQRPDSSKTDETQSELADFLGLM